MCCVYNNNIFYKTHKINHIIFFNYGKISFSKLSTTLLANFNLS